MSCHIEFHLLSEYARIYPPNHDNMSVCVCEWLCGVPHIALSCLRGPMYWCVSMKTYPLFFVYAWVYVCVFVWIWTLLVKRRECVCMYVYVGENESHHRVVSTVNFSLEKGFFIAITRQLSPAKRHAHQTALSWVSFFILIVYRMRFVK